VANADVRIGVAGLGTIGRVHVRNLQGHIPSARLARVVDSAQEALAPATGIPASKDFGDLLADPRVDAVLIATPPSTHAEMVRQAAGAGKHVFCEKPLALEIADAEAALAAVEDAGVLLQIGFHRRFDRDFVDARARIARGDLGDIRSFFGSTRDMRPPPVEALRSGEQTLVHDTACHDFDAARWLVGEIDEVTTRGAALASPEIWEAGEIDHAVTLLRFAHGALGIIENSLASGYGFDCRCEITGSDATLRVDQPHLSGVERLDGGGSRFARAPTFLERFEGAYRHELAAFAAAVAGDRQVEVDGEDGLAAVVLANAAEVSLERGTTVRVRRVGTNFALRYELDVPSELRAPPTSEAAGVRPAGSP
jgi:predicted dehydrogenase